MASILNSKQYALRNPSKGLLPCTTWEKRKQQHDSIDKNLFHCQYHLLLSKINSLTVDASFHEVIIISFAFLLFSHCSQLSNFIYFKQGQSRSLESYCLIHCSALYLANFFGKPKNFDHLLKRNWNSFFSNKNNKIQQRYTFL